MIIIKKLIITIIAVTSFFHLYGHESDNEIRVHLTGKKYDSLNMIIRIDHGGERAVRKAIPGVTQNGYDWLFSYPDSIYEKHTYITFEMPTAVDSIGYGIGFKLVIEMDTLFAGGGCLTKGKSEVYLDYLYTDVHSGVIVYSETAKTYILRTFYQDQFLVKPSSDLGLIASIEALSMRYCKFPKIETENYDQQLDQYLQLTKKYPNSRYLAFYLNSSFTPFNSKKDIDLIYNCFTAEIKQSIFGERIKDFLEADDTLFEYDDALPIFEQKPIKRFQ